MIWRLEPLPQTLRPTAPLYTSPGAKGRVTESKPFVEFMTRSLALGVCAKPHEIGGGRRTTGFTQQIEPFCQQQDNWTVSSS